MKQARRLFAFVAAIVMAVALIPATAFADGETQPGSITVTGQNVASGEQSTTYELYRIFDVTAAKDGEGEYIMEKGEYASMAYTINENWAGFFTGSAAGAKYIVGQNDKTANDGDGYTPIVVDGVVKYIELTESNVANFGKDALNFSQKNNISPVISNTTGIFTGLDLGYYMVYPKGANLNVDPYTSIVSLTTTSPNATVVQKAEYPTLEKTDDDNSVEVGQVVKYTLTSKVPDTTGYDTFTFKMHDQMTKGLTFNSTSIDVKIDGTSIGAYDEGTNDGGFTYAPETADSNHETAFSISIPVMKYQNEIGTSIVVTYTATVNSDAVTKVESNKAYLEYSNNPKDETKKTDTPEDIEEVFTAKIVIDKYDATNINAKLADAKFVLRCKSVTDTGDAAKAEAGKYYKYDQSTDTVSWVEESAVDNKVTAGEAALETDVSGATVVTTNESGAAEFAGLENGDYELIEVAAPSGYNQIKGVAAEVTVNGTKDNTASLTATSQVANNSGTELPSTGGIGTTIFYVVGGLLVAGAAVSLVVRRRAAAE